MGTFDDLPIAILSEIFCRLTAKQCFQLRTLNHCCLEALSGRHFAQMQFRQSKTSLPAHHYLLEVEERSLVAHLIPFPNVLGERDCYPVRDATLGLDRAKGTYLEFEASCEGLAIVKLIPPAASPEVQSYVVWNPLTAQCWPLPNTGFVSAAKVALALDNSGLSYVAFCFSDQKPWQVKHIRASDQEWSAPVPVPYQIVDRLYYSAGHLYSLCSDQTLLCFDPQGNSFSTIPLPVIWKNSRRQIFESDGTIYLGVNYRWWSTRLWQLNGNEWQLIAQLRDGINKDFHMLWFGGTRGPCLDED